jgi:hypothetical protein
LNTEEARERNNYLLPTGCQINELWPTVKKSPDRREIIVFLHGFWNSTSIKKNGHYSPNVDVF